MTASEMVTLLETALATNAGVVSVTIDGLQVRYDRKQALAELEHWRRRAAAESGTMPRYATIDLSGF